MPHVLRYNKPVTEQAQHYVSAAFGRPDEDAADLVHEFIASLGLPQTLRDVGVTRDDFDGIARRSVASMWVRTSWRRADWKPAFLTLRHVRLGSGSGGSAEKVRRDVRRACH
jgi:maleylacetate reductase